MVWYGATGINQVSDQILAEIRKLAAANDGKAPGNRLFMSQTGIRETAWRGLYWARWGDALVEAGFAPKYVRRQT